MGSDRVYADGSAVRREPWTGLWYAVEPGGEPLTLPDPERGGRPTRRLFSRPELARLALHVAGYARARAA